ncbi:MAG TPA: mannose-1-phosphate guanylyltransferase/mannose-6-phosphate isomerase [Rhizomicrobium sp.]|jgi:mannose-1-phosphate guanylyltransferase/mannose-6-phosphate isomerase
MVAPVHPVILSGGVGSRLWPLSRSLYPKQLLALASERTMIQATALRVSGAMFAPPLVVCNEEHRFLVAEQMRESGRPAEKIILEPMGRNTAPAAAVAALWLAGRDPDALIMLLPADHVVLVDDAFLAATRDAAIAATAGEIVLFGIVARQPETGFGYIEQGAPLVAGSFRVARFCEKPDRATAENYLRSGRFYWNSGMFLFKASVYLAELERLEPEMMAACRAAMRDGQSDADFFRLEKSAFSRCPSRSIDYAVMEHTARAAVVPVEMGWNDVGSWLSLWEIGDKDNASNVIRGDVIHHETERSYLRSEGPLIATVGVRDLVVVATADAVLISDRSATQDVKVIVDRLERSDRNLHRSHRQVFRPWGSFECLDNAEGFEIRKLLVRPGGEVEATTLGNPSSYWLVLSGTGEIVGAQPGVVLRAGMSIPCHGRSLRNPGDDTLRVLEIASNSIPALS